MLDLHLISEDKTKLPENIIPLFRKNGQTDSNGYVTINNITFDSGISSVYYIRPILIYPLSDLTNQNLSSSLQDLIFQIYNPEYRNALTLENYAAFTDGLSLLKDLDLISYCYGNILNFTLVSQIGSIQLLNSTQYQTPFQLNQTYYFKIRIYSLNNLALSNTSINLDFNLVHFPSYLMNDYMFMSAYMNEFKQISIQFSQISKITDNNGEILLKFRLNI